MQSDDILDKEFESADEKEEGYHLAGAGARFGNYMIDIISIIAIFAVIMMLLSVFKVYQIQESDTVILYSIYYSILITYYIAFESLTGRTLGKIITGTMIVDDEGYDASLNKIIIRTFCRFIPFEQLSFLGRDTIGWHDSISKTRIIKVRK